MSAETVAIVVAGLSVVGAACTGLGKALVQMYRTRREGATEEDARNPVGGFVQLTDGLQGEIQRLREDQQEDRQQLQTLRRDVAQLLQEAQGERNLRQLAVGYIARLHDWIDRHVHDARDRPRVPDELAPHIEIPSRRRG